MYVCVRVRVCLFAANTILMYIKWTYACVWIPANVKCQMPKYPNERRSDATQKFGKCPQAWKSLMS